MTDYESVRSDWWALLNWHLAVHGTRPDDHPSKQGIPWKDDEFARECSVGDPENPRHGARTVAYWHQTDVHKKRVVPGNIVVIEKALFGTNPAYNTPEYPWLADLRTTHAKAKKKQNKSLVAESNIRISVPTHFCGREDKLAAIKRGLQPPKGQAAVVVLYGLRGVGKTALAVAYTDRYGSKYQAAWWINAHTELSIRADLVDLGVRLGWTSIDEKEESAIAKVLNRLERKDERILLIYDNSPNEKSIKPYLPRKGSTHIIITSNVHAWHGIARAVIEVKVWPKRIGGEFLIARSGRGGDRDAAEALSEALEGLPLAHEMAGAYCEQREKSLAEYHKLFNATPVQFLDDARYAPVEYGRTVAKTFTLAINEAAELHAGAEPLIVLASFLAPEPIPLFFFSEARDKFDEPLASALIGDGLDDAVAALRAFALVSREPIAIEGDESIMADAIRLHRLVREVAAARCRNEARDRLRCALIAALVAVYPRDSWDNPASWSRCAIFMPHLIVTCQAETADKSRNEDRADLLGLAGGYLHAHGAYSGARELLEDALIISEKVLGPEHPDTASSLNNLALVLKVQGDLSAAQPLYERALAISEKVLGPEHPHTANSLDNLAGLLHARGDTAAALPLSERALKINEKVLGPEHRYTAISLNTMASLLYAQRNLLGARSCYERALAINEKVLGPEHPDTALSLNNLGFLLKAQGDLAGARPLYERALEIREKVFGPDHPSTVNSYFNLAYLLEAQRDFVALRALIERDLAMLEERVAKYSQEP